jgi:hypothetical protein
VILILLSGLLVSCVGATRMPVRSRGPVGAQFQASQLLIIWLLQQATIGSVAACHDRRSRERFASFSLTLLGRKPASNIWALAGGQMGSLVRDAGTEKLMSW